MPSKIIAGVSLGLIWAFALPLAITNFAFGITDHVPCDTEDTMGLDVGDYLVGSGISGIAICALLSFMYILILLDISPNIASGRAIMVTNLYSALFAFVWFIVGAIILFKGNIECIKDSSTHVIYALEMWCISVLCMAMNCCSAVSIRENTLTNLPSIF